MQPNHTMYELPKTTLLFIFSCPCSFRRLIEQEHDYMKTKRSTTI